MTITVDSKAFKKIMDKLNFIEQTIIAMSPKNSVSKWMSEAEVMALLNLSKRSLQRKRSAGILEWSTESGRKIKYLRKSVDRFLDKNSTMIKK